MPSEVERKLAAILSADVVGYARLMAEDEAGTIRTLGAYRDEIRLLVEQHRGRVVDFTGDNFLAEFPTALDAVECAVEVQRVLKARNAALPEGRQMEFRIGVHLGDVAVEGERLYGDGVNIAARLEGLAEPGGVCISDDVLHQVQRKLELDFDDMGEQEVKNIPDPVHAYRLRERATESPTTGASLRIGIRPVVVGLAVIAFVALAWWGWNRPVSTTGPIRSIAVLPLENLSGDPDQAYFVDGMTEALIGDLARIGALNVISRTSVMRYKQTDKSLPEIARELSVEGIIEGTVMRDGDRVRITVQLIDARTDHHVWSDRYDRELSDTLGLQSDVARAVARQIELTLTPQEASRLANTRRVDPAAHEAYLRGRFFWNKRGESLFKAIDYFQEAIDIDPEYAAAYAGLADSYLMLAFYVPSPPRELMPKAEAAAMKALELDDSLAEPHVVLGFVRLYYDWDWVGAEREFQRAVELSPNDATVRMRRAFYLAVQRRPDEALVEMQAARDLDPLSPTIQRSLGTLYYWTRRYELAIQEFRDALELDPGIPQARAMLARALVRQGKLEEATREIDLVGNSLLDRTERALIQALTGQRASALQALEEIKRDPAVRYLVPTVVAETYGALGDLDQAFEWMEVAFQEKDPSLLVMLADQNPSRLRSDPRSDDLRRRIGLPES